MLALFAALLNIQLPIHAADHTASKAFLDGVSYQASKDGWSAYGQGFTLKMDGEVVFCVDPKTEVVSGGGYKESDFPSSQALKLSVIAYEGYYKNRNKSDVDYYKFAVNLMIWEEMGWTISASGFDYAGYKKKIQNAVDKHSTLPSFHRTDITLDIGESTTLTDINGVFNEFHLISSDGLTVTKNGNNLTITATADAKDKAKIK